MKKVIEYGIASVTTGKVLSKTFKSRHEVEEFCANRSNPDHWKILYREIEYGDWKSSDLKHKIHIGDKVRVINPHSEYHPYGTIGTVYTITEAVDMSSKSHYSAFQYEVRANDVTHVYVEDAIEFVEENKGEKYREEED